jgi:hypothetical protein
LGAQSPRESAKTAGPREGRFGASAPNAGILAPMLKPAFFSLALSFTLAASAADPAPKDGKASAETKKKAKAFELSLPPMGSVPATDGIAKPKAELPSDSPKVTAGNATFTVVRAVHAKAFTRTPNGALPAGGALEAVSLSGNPPETERFSTVLRIKSPQRQNAAIDLVIMDPRGDTVMTSRGEVNFRGTKADEVDYSVEWDPTPWPKGGEFQLLVRIGGQMIGTYPLKVALK